jgi:hypothetical protein
MPGSIVCPAKTLWSALCSVPIASHWSKHATLSTPVWPPNTSTRCVGCLLGYRLILLMGCFGLVLQEEDFVTQLYNRNLLSSFDSSHFYRLLDQAVEWVDDQEHIDQRLRDAIQSRLLLRREFLASVDQDLEILDTRSTDSFATCLTHLKTLTETVSCGKAVPEAFSLKLQRKLASTVPPRPIVHIKQEDALAHMKRLCQDAIDMQQMLDYRGPSNFKVWSWKKQLIDHVLTYVLLLDCRVDFAVTKTPAVSLYSLTAAGLDCQRHDNSWGCISQGVPL